MTATYSDKDLVLTFETLDKHLSKVLNIPLLKNEFKAKETSKAFIQYCLDFYGWLIKELKKTDKNKSSYQTSINKHIEKVHLDFDTSLNIDYKKEFHILTNNDLKDHLQYIYIWLLNNYQINIDSILDEEIQNLKIEEITPADQEKNDKATFLANSFLNMPDGSKFYDNPSGYIEQCLNKTHALNRLAHDVKMGKIYIYETKPARNIVIKSVLLFLNYCAIFISFLFLLWAIIFISSNLPKLSDANAALDPSIFKLNRLFAVSLISFIFFAYSLKDGLMAFKNDNFKFVFSKKMCWYCLIFSTIFLFLNVFDGSFRSLFYQPSTTTKDSGEDTFFITLHSILIFLIMSITTINVCSYIWLNPNRNDKLIQNLLEQYSSGKNKPNGFDQSKQ